MKTLILTLLLASSAFAQGEDFTVPPGYEIVARDGNRVEVKDLTTGYITPYLTNWDSDKAQTPIIAETQDELPRQWYYFEQIAELPWCTRIVTADLNHSGTGEIYCWAMGTTYLDTLISEWDFEVLTMGDYDGPRMSGDTDNDGNSELLTHGNIYFSLLESDSLNSYPSNVIWSHNHGTYTEMNPKLGDIDQDGWGEVMYYTNPHTAYQVFELNSNGEYLLKSSMRFWDYINDWAGEPCFGDVDGDGLTEVIAGGIHGEVIIFENVMDDSMEFVWADTLGAPNQYSTEFLGDTDGDGRNEFMMAASPGCLFTIFEGNGNNEYELVYEICISAPWWSAGYIWVGDFAGEGFREIVLCTGWNITVLRAVADNDWIELVRYANHSYDFAAYPYHVDDNYRDYILNPVLGSPYSRTRMISLGGAYYPGDLNGNGAVEGTDVTYFVSYLKTGNPPIPDPITRADANGDCGINLLDVTYLVNYFKGRVPAPEPGWCNFELDE